ncbi:MAG: tetratricopeptide repeat protein [Bacteriovorax sp.]|nr:tetratricopeptide repeat protein [Bacteriovorax sp.]
MKCLQLPLILSLILVLPACKTQEDIRREKTVENLNEQVAQSQKSTANASSRFTALEEEMAKLTGRIEESTHNRQQEIKDFALVKDRLNSLEETNKKQTEFMKALNEKIQDQSKYIEQVIASISSLNEQKEQAKKKASKEESSSSEVATIKGAMAKYKEKELEGSKEMFLTILDSKKSKKKDKETSSYYLGMIEYKEKNYEEAKVYFSKLFSENPDSTYGASTLLNLAKSFIQLKSKEEARQSLDELITRYPKSKEAQEGAKLKTKI